MNSLSRHPHEGHAHLAHHLDSAAPGRLTGRLKWAIAATLGLVLAELAGGLTSHSIALVTDAVHNLTDAPTLVISWLAARWAERPPTSEKTYGYHRAGILAAFTNALVLVFVAGFLIWESYERFRRPVGVHSGIMLALGAVALVVNGGITLGLVRGRTDLNLRSVLIHNLGDALSNVGILIGALVIMWTGAAWVDPLIGLAIGIMVLWTTFGILRDSIHILLEGLPKEMQLEQIARVILAVEHVQEVHDIHVWTLGTGHHVLSCHVRILDMHIEESETLLEQINERLGHEFGIFHTTIQFERARAAARSGFYMPAPFDSGTH
ncbi:MAG TPA: cation diffusion facilitator family transporter [Candidatus Dormibacteraeota bacterium]|nr:cation diffusion facilitator family transporter [Candidatus Dormibacteraeota bacterium]